MKQYQPFQKALPVWPEGREKEMNVTCRFTAEVPQEKGIVLRMTGSSLYRVFVNGAMIAYGPARGPKFWFRVDELSLTPYLTKESNLVLFEAVGYNINNFYTLDQPSFFQAEIVTGNTVLAWTAPEGGMPCDIVTERIQKIQKYTFQRAFAEAWRIGKAYADSFFRMTAGRTPLAFCGEKQYLPRRVPFPRYEKLSVTERIGTGTVTVEKQLIRKHDPSFVGIIPEQKGYSDDELEVQMTLDTKRMSFSAEAFSTEALTDETVLTVRDHHYETVRFPADRSGFLGLKVKAETPVTLYFLFDEYYDGDFNFDHCWYNIVRYDLLPGEYRLLAMETLTLQYWRIVALGGDVQISDLHMIEYTAPDDGFCTFETAEPNFRKIWDAAVQTYRQNAVDLYTDCPGRERAGWLCDSFWTARSEFALTGKTVIERNFLENFLIPDSFEHIPKGMFPMCYPSDHYDELYIPNWAMWLVMEVREYLDRSGDREMIDAFREKFYALFAFLDTFRNEDGLLEKLDKWVFLEWSDANLYIQDVNFPTNMLYAACLEAAGEMYGDAALTARAEAMKETIRRLSFNGRFFTDHLVRNSQGVLENPGHMTEVCQYYAFYFGTATKERYPELWEILLKDFGLQRKHDNRYPEVSFASAFIGNYLRLDLMARNGAMKEVLDSIEGYFLHMAEATGTLWESNSPTASLNHGFASHVLVWLKDAQPQRS